MIRKDKKTFKDGTVKTQNPRYGRLPPLSKLFPETADSQKLRLPGRPNGPGGFWNEVNACNNSLKKKEVSQSRTPVSKMMYSDHNRLLNYGYKFPESVYRLLEIDSFMNDTRNIPDSVGNIP